MGGDCLSTDIRRIIMADELGYCWGVRRALDIIEKAGQPEDPVATVGDVIHNPQVVDRLRSQGVQTADTVEEAAARGFKRIAITAHGAGPERAREANERGLDLIDTTCPLVTKVQRLAAKLVTQGYFIVVYGDHYHPEVRGIISWSDTSRAVAAKKIEDLPWNAPRGTIGENVEAPPRKVAVISQTTKMVEEFLAFTRELTEMVAREGGEIRICNTICEPTYERQNALKRLASQVDLILAIGGKKSSNTARLAEVGRAFGVESHHIESSEEIDESWLETVDNIGVTAGASTPDDVIEDVIERLTSFGFEPPVQGMKPVDLEELPSY
jgi:4-hydroxy-3-methylbut-2-en-1-yl diphosphate reductase